MRPGASRRRSTRSRRPLPLERQTNGSTLRVVTIRTAVATDDASAKRLLIVADEWSGVGSIRQALEGTGLHVVHVAETRRQAPSFLDESQVDFAVIRLALPDADGIELARAIEDSWPPARVVISGPAEREALSEVILAGVTAWVDEDANTDDLVEANPPGGPRVAGRGPAR
jgi:CheY-like chemotaxis protein